MSVLKYCVYVVVSLKDGNLYVGITKNLKERLTAHFSGYSKSTAPRRPFRLIYSEYYLSEHDAYRREKYLKTTTGRRMLKLILKYSLKETPSYLLDSNS